MAEKPKQGGGKPARNITRRQFLKVSGTAAGAALLAACGARTSAPEVTPEPTGMIKPPDTAADNTVEAPAVLKGATVNFLGYSYFVPEMNEVFQSFAIDWATQNGVKFNLEMATTNDIAARVATAIETKQGPNIVQFVAPPASIVGGLVDISELAEHIGSQQEGWYPTAPAVSRVDGRWYAVPIGSHTMMVNYRRDWFAEAGFDAFPDDWDTFLEAGKALKAAGHPYGYVFSGGQAPFDGLGHSLILLWSFGGREFDENGDLALDSPETMQALEYAIQLYNDTCDPGAAAYNDATNNQAFLAGQLSCTFNVNTIYLPAIESNPELAEAMDHAVPPQGPGGRFSYQGFPFMGILNHTTGADRDAAIEFMRDFFEASNYAQWIKLGQGYLVPMAPLYENLPIWPSDPKLKVAREVGALGRWAGYALPSPTPLASLMTSQFTIGNMFTSAVTSGDARTALDQTLQEIEDLKQQAG